MTMKWPVRNLLRTLKLVSLATMAFCFIISVQVFSSRTIDVSYQLIEIIHEQPAETKESTVTQKPTQVQIQS